MNYALVVKEGHVHQRFPINLPTLPLARVTSNSIISPVFNRQEASWCIVWRSNPPGSVMTEHFSDNVDADGWAACVCAHGFDIALEFQ